ncbi:MAG: rod shape-determining protein MreC [Pseudomonadota bacterium]
MGAFDEFKSYQGFGSRRRRGRPYGLVFFALLSCMMLLLSRQAAEASVFEKARAGVADAAAPLLSVLSGPIGFVNSVLGDIGDYFSVVEENRRLKAEIAELSRVKAQAIALQSYAERLQKLANMQAEPSITYTTARVIGDSEGPFVRAMIVNVGGEAVNRGQAVINEYGLVGHVVTPGKVSSRVLLLTDLNSRIPVFVEGANALGVLAGDNSNRPKLRYIEEPSALTPGQKVITSGDGGVLPRGLPVGVVARAGASATVKPFVDFDQTELVRVVAYGFPRDVEPLETSGGDASDAEQTGLPAPEISAVDAPTIGESAGLDAPPAAANPDSEERQPRQITFTPSLAPPRPAAFEADASEIELVQPVEPAAGDDQGSVPDAAAAAAPIAIGVPGPIQIEALAPVSPVTPPADIQTETLAGGPAPNSAELDAAELDAAEPGADEPGALEAN